MCILFQEEDQFDKASNALFFLKLGEALITEFMLIANRGQME